MGIKNRVPPALILLLVSPMIAELVSGSSPPSEYFTPFSFVVLTLLYGGGANLVREIKIRWRKGVGSLLLLGASYGVIEEGIMVASWFNPSWPDLGFMGVFGRWLGVNWVWAVDLTIYHAIISITVPILLVELAYPERRGESWLRGKSLYVVAALFVLDVFFGLFLFSRVTGYAPEFIQIGFALVVAASLFYSAHRLKRNWVIALNRPIRRPLYYLLYTFLGSVVCGGTFYVLPSLIPTSGGPILVVVVGVALILLLLRGLRFNWGNSTDTHRLAICVGSLMFLILLTPIQELDKSRLDNTKGMVAVGFVSVILLLLLYRAVRKRVHRDHLLSAEVVEEVGLLSKLVGSVAGRGAD